MRVLKGSNSRSSEDVAAGILETSLNLQRISDQGAQSCHALSSRSIVSVHSRLLASDPDPSARMKCI